MIAPEEKQLLKKSTETRVRERLGKKSLAKAVDHAIYLAFPKWGLKRKQSRLRHEMMSIQTEILADRMQSLAGSRAFDGAEDKDVRRWLTSGLFVDSALEEDLPTLQERCSHLYRNNSIAASAIEGRVTNEVGTGIKVNSRVSPEDGFSVDYAKQVRRELEERHKLWSEYGVDKRRQLSYTQLQKVVCRSYATYGEAFILVGDRSFEPPLVPMTCDMFSPEQIESPPDKTADPFCRAGVQYSEVTEEVLGYWVRRSHPGDTKLPQYEFDFYPRFDSNGFPRMIHVFDPLFPNQSRGIPWLAAALERIKDVEDFIEAELIAKQIEACFGLVFTSGSAAQSPMDMAAANASGGGTSSTGKRLEEITPGLVHYAAEDETVTTIDPNRPGASFAPFIEVSLRTIAGALNFPYELLAKNFFRTTFSSGQLAMLDGKLAFRMRQKVEIEQLCIPLWKRFVFENIFMDELGGLVDFLDYRANPQFYERAVHQPQGWGFINPKDEVEANSIELEDDTTTLSSVYSSKGLDAEEQLDRRYDEKTKLVEQDVELRKLQWDLETQNGLPHKEEQSQEQQEQGEPAGAI